jgi:microcystin-dependent protein
MGTPFLGELKIVGFNFAPQGWAHANGQLLPINQNQALFSILGTTYGGNGQTNFALPNLRGRTPIHTGSGHTLGEAGGQDAHTVTLSEMPQHIHIANGTTTTGTLNNGTGNFFGVSQTPVYAPAGNFVAIEPTSVTSTGGSQAHENRQPYLVLNIIIALQGVFPSRN